MASPQVRLITCLLRMISPCAFSYFLAGSSTPSWPDAPVLSHAQPRSSRQEYRLLQKPHEIFYFLQIQPAITSSRKSSLDFAAKARAISTLLDPPW
jgi:hypothetical protein